MCVEELVNSMTSDGDTKIEFIHEQNGDLLIRMERSGWRGFRIVRAWELSDRDNYEHIIKYNLERLNMVYETAMSILTNFNK